MAGRVLIFGASGGVGGALARRLHASGAPVFLCARDEAVLDALKAELGAPGRACDVLDSEQIAAAVEAASAEKGRLTGLAFCVGSIDLAPLRRQNREGLRRAFELNAVSALEAVRLAEPALRKGGGSVVLFSTIAVAQGFTNHVAIAAAKGAVEGLTRALAADLAPAVRVNAVAPSLMRTGIAQPITGNEPLAQAVAQLHALPRLGEADDAAAAAAYLLSPDSGWMTGQVLAVDGGRSRVRTKG